MERPAFFLPEYMTFWDCLNIHVISYNEPPRAKYDDGGSAARDQPSRDLDTSEDVCAKPIVCLVEVQRIDGSGSCAKTYIIPGSSRVKERKYMQFSMQAELPALPSVLNCRLFLSSSTETPKQYMRIGAYVYVYIYIHVRTYRAERKFPPPGTTFRPMLTKY